MKHLIDLTPEVCLIISKVHSVFKDEQKTYSWMTIKNLNFGGWSALELIQSGRGPKVLQFIESALMGPQELPTEWSKQ